jgi:hypothetical protein
LKITQNPRFWQNYLKSTQKSFQNPLFLDTPKYLFTSGMLLDQTNRPHNATCLPKIIEKRPKKDVKQAKKCKKSYSNLSTRAIEEHLKKSSKNHGN